MCLLLLYLCVLFLCVIFVCYFCVSYSETGTQPAQLNYFDAYVLLCVMVYFMRLILHHFIVKQKRNPHEYIILMRTLFLVSWFT